MKCDGYVHFQSLFLICSGDRNCCCLRIARDRLVMSKLTLCSVYKVAFSYSFGLLLVQYDYKMMCE